MPTKGFKTQGMYMEVIVPLVPLLDQADNEDFTLNEAILMIYVVCHSAPRGCSSAPVYCLKRIKLMKHLNPQLHSLMKDINFKVAQPF